MGSSAALKVVETAPEPVSESSGVVREAAGQSRRALLVALRDRIAADIDDGVPARDLASLSKRLLDISAELDAVSAAEDGDAISEAAETPDEAWDG